MKIDKYDLFEGTKEVWQRKDTPRGNLGVECFAANVLAMSEDVKRIYDNVEKYCEGRGLNFKALRHGERHKMLTDSIPPDSAIFWVECADDDGYSLPVGDMFNYVRMTFWATGVKDGEG